MAYVINDDCISCGVCVDECPTDAIKEEDDKYIIDEDACVDCAACVAVCPVDAIESK
jgi:ferredoxin